MPCSVSRGYPARTGPVRWVSLQIYEGENHDDADGPGNVKLAEIVWPLRQPSGDG